MLQLGIIRYLVLFQYSTPRSVNVNLINVCILQPLQRQSTHFITLSHHIQLQQTGHKTYQNLIVFDIHILFQHYTQFVIYQNKQYYQHMNFLKSTISFFSLPSPNTNILERPPVSMNSQTFELLDPEAEHTEHINSNSESALVILEEPVYHIIQNKYFRQIVIENKHSEKPLTIQQWQDIIKNKSFQGTCRKNLILSIYKGIPPHIRKELWTILANTNDMPQRSYIKYSELASQESSSIGIIQKDVHRAKGDDKFKRMLINVLVAYSNLDPLSYTQGMSIIVASLLSLLQDKSCPEEATQILEERVFWVFVGIMYGKNWRSYFQDMKKSSCLLSELQILMSQYTPDVLDHIRCHELDLNMCFVQYYLTLIIYNCPEELATIVLDLFLLYGQQALHSMILRMIQVFEDRILGMNDMGDVVNFFKVGMLQQCNKLILKDAQTCTRLQEFTFNFFVVEEQ